VSKHIPRSAVYFVARQQEPRTAIDAIVAALEEANA
jgi:hypothetical protein